MKPFIIHSLPRSGSRLICSLLRSHPELNCAHEYMGDLEGFLKLGGALMHWHHTPDWAWNVDVTRIHLTRNYSKGAMSQLLMNYHGFPSRSFDLPKWTVDELAEQRKEMDRKLLEKITPDLTVTYEEMTDDNNIEFMPAGIRKILLHTIGVDDHPLTVVHKKKTMIPRNLNECLNVA